MWKAKYIADQVWKVWENELRRMLKSKLIERGWPKLKEEFESYPEFLKFVENVRREKEPIPAEATANKSLEPTAS